MKWNTEGMRAWYVLALNVWLPVAYAMGLHNVVDPTTFGLAEAAIIGTVTGFFKAYPAYKAPEPVTAPLSFETLKASIEAYGYTVRSANGQFVGSGGVAGSVAPPQTGGTVRPSRRPRSGKS